MGPGLESGLMSMPRSLPTRPAGVADGKRTPICRTRNDGGDLHGGEVAGETAEP